jgi:hypothetical protein
MSNYTSNFSNEAWSGISGLVIDLPTDIASKILNKIPVAVIQENMHFMFRNNNIKNPYVIYLLSRKKINFSVPLKIYSWNPHTRKESYKTVPPLYLAVSNKCSVDVIKALIKCGADVNWKDQNGKTAYDIATSENLKNEIDKTTDWVVISSNTKDGKKVAKTLKNFVINPGCLYIYKNELIFNVLARSIRDNVRDENFDFANIKSCYPEDKIIDITGIRYVGPFAQRLICRVNKIFKLLKICKYFW